MRNIYRMIAPELAEAAREQREKCSTLHKERGKAWHGMLDATTQHEFLVEACRVAESEEDEIMSRLQEVIRREAYEMAS